MSLRTAAPSADVTLHAIKLTECASAGSLVLINSPMSICRAALSDTAVSDGKSQRPRSERERGEQGGTGEKRSRNGAEWNLYEPSWHRSSGDQRVSEDSSLLTAFPGAIQ